MTTSAIVMLSVSLATVWGGLIASVVHLLRHSAEYRDDTE